MDIPRMKRSHRTLWIAAVGFAALLGSPSPAFAPPCFITFPGPPPSDGTVGVAYEQGIQGIASFFQYVDNYAVTAGTLPPGLTLQLRGNRPAAIVGTPTAAGQFTFTIRAYTYLCFGDVAYTVNIAAAVPTLPEWAMIALTVLLTVAGVVGMRCRMT